MYSSNKESHIDLYITFCSYDPRQEVDDMLVKWSFLLLQIQEPPITEPKVWWHKIAVKRKDVSRRQALEHIGPRVPSLKVHKIEIFFGSDFEICIISLLFMSKY